jgi:hypothetical protein
LPLTTGRPAFGTFGDYAALTQLGLAFTNHWRGSILLVVHAFYEEHDEEVIRVISARAAESHERRAYEEAHKGAEARDPGYRRKKRRRH